MLRLCLALLLLPAACLAAEEPAGRIEALYNQALGSAPKERIPLLTEALRLSPKDARLWVALGDAYAYPGVATDGNEEPKALDTGYGVKVYEQATRFCPDSPLPYLRLAELRWDNDKAAAAQYLEKAAAADPQNALPLYERALLHFQAKEDAEGLRALAAARPRKLIRLPVLLPTAPLPLVQAVNAAGQARLPECARLRELARETVRAAGEVPASGTAAAAGQAPAGGAVGAAGGVPAGAEAAHQALLDVQRMAYRLMAAEPRTLITFLVGLAVDDTAAPSLRLFLLGRGDQAGLARVDARRQTIRGLREKARAVVASLGAGLTGADQPIEVFRQEADATRKLLAESGLKEPGE